MTPLTLHETLLKMHGDAMVALADECRAAAMRALGAEHVASLTSDRERGLSFAVALPPHRPVGSGAPGERLGVVAHVIVTSA